MTGHTPGPWRVDEDKPDHTAIVVVDESGNEVAGVWRTRRDDGERGEANAALIASAPILAQRVAALEKLVRGYLATAPEDGPNMRALDDRARAALAEGGGA